MAEEKWTDRAIDRTLAAAKEMPLIGRAAEWLADRRETRQQDDAFWKSADVSISNHEHSQQMNTWRNALPPTEREVRANDEFVERRVEEMLNRRSVAPAAWEMPRLDLDNWVVAGERFDRDPKQTELPLPHPKQDQVRAYPPGLGFEQFSERDPVDYHKRSERDAAMSSPPSNARAEIAVKLNDAADWRKSFEIHPDPGSKEIARGIIQEARSIRTTDRSPEIQRDTGISR